MNSRPSRDNDRPAAAHALKEVCFTVLVTAAFTLGFYSLLVASMKKGATIGEERFSNASASASSCSDAIADIY